jgi:C4-dicarboxylate-specific signal transduction histidine kinase
LNALDALPAEGILRVRGRKRKNEIDLVIAERSWHPAQHNGATLYPFVTTKAGKEAGLGLALSKRIIQRHRGRIWMRSSIRLGKAVRLSKSLCLFEK